MESSTLTSAPPTPSRLLILGATGETGKQALLAALASPSVSSVHSFGRSAPSLPSSLPPSDASKLTHTSLDFEALLSEQSSASHAFGTTGEGEKLRKVGADAVTCAIGTNNKTSRTQEEYVRVDREYVLAAARAARREDMKEQRVVLVSAGGASSSSFFFYQRSKGLLEEGLADMGYKETIVVRPGFLAVPGGGRAGAPWLERMAGNFINALASFSSSFFSSLQIATPTLGRALVNAATFAPQQLRTPQYGRLETLQGNGKNVWAVSNAQALALGAEKV
ncbi:hypothetical protein JCM8547_007393 [Rhodosporidiobolus lusitaniae]